jgi:hypothetical protein
MSHCECSSIESISSNMWLNSIFPFVGDGYFFLIGSVNRSFHIAYVGKYPDRRTDYNLLTISAIQYYCRNRIPVSQQSVFYKLAMQHENISVLDFLRSSGYDMGSIVYLDAI